MPTRSISYLFLLLLTVLPVSAQAPAVVHVQLRIPGQVPVSIPIAGRIIVQFEATADSAGALPGDVAAVADSGTALPTVPVPVSAEAGTGSANGDTVAPRPQSAAPRPAARQAAEPRRWAAALDLGFTSSSGNSDLTALTTGIRIRHLQTRVFKLDWSLSFRYGESQGDVVARHVQSKLDFDMGPGARFAPFIAASGERDPFRKLDLRSKAGSGIRYAFYRGERGDAAFRLAALYSHERFTPDAQRDPRSDGTWSLEVKSAQSLGDNIKVENTSTWDPVMGDLVDYNLDVKTKISSRISRRLALTLQHQYAFDSTPAASVGHSDSRFQAGLTIDF